MPALSALQPGQVIVYGGSKYTTVPEALAEAFVPGDRLVVVNETGDLLHVPAAEAEIAATAVGRAVDAFAALGAVVDEAISDFFEQFARRLEDDTTFAPIAEANAADVAGAKAKGVRPHDSSCRRPCAPTWCRARSWRDADLACDGVIETISHVGWTVEQRRAGLGSSASCSRVGRTCSPMPAACCAPATPWSSASAPMRWVPQTPSSSTALTLRLLPQDSAGAASLRTRQRAAGHAMFDDPRLALAVA
ncbi:MAG: hypothetical protein R2710_01355 [Acidimicrobiales bacterium]